MYFGKNQDVAFDDIRCERKKRKKPIGYICEQPVPCQDTKENEKREDHRPSACQHSTAKPPQVTSASQSSTSLQQQSAVSLSTTPGKAVSDVPPSKAEKDNSQSITIALTALAVIILLILILIWFFLVRRPWSKASSLKTQPDDSNQHQENSNQITMRANLTPSEEGLDAYETVNEDRQVHTYERVKNGNRIPGSTAHRESSVHAQEPIMQTQSGDDYLVPSDLSESMETTKKPDVCDENSDKKETTKEHVYAVVHVHQGRQGRAIFRKGKMVQGESLDLTGAPLLPVIGESREESGNSSSVISEKAVSMTEDYVYAVVDKAKQKQNPPQMPAPYRSLVYSDLSHFPDKSAGSICRRIPPTVYSAIYYDKTDEMKSKLPEENVGQLAESTDG